MPVERHLRALEAAVDGPLTLGALAHRLRDAGFGLIVIFVCLPFLQPIPMGGLSSIVGPFIALQGFQLMRGRKELYLPSWLAGRRLDEKTLHVLLGGSRRFFGLAEKVVRPRWRGLAGSERAAGAGIVLSGALLSLPFPIPLSNIFCAGPAVLFSLSMLEEDGVLAVMGWLALAVSLAFHAGVFLLGADGTKALWLALRG